MSESVRPVRLRDLETRLSAAMGPDRELEREIAKVFLLTRDGEPLSDRDAENAASAWTSSIDAADALRKRVLPKSWRRSCSTLWDGQSCSAEVRTEAPGTSWGTAPTEPLAILLATIRALIAREEGR